EVGRRKPDPSGAQNVLTAVDADPRRAWFVGDKPHRDVPAARAGGVGTVVIVRGGATRDDELEEAFASDPALRPDQLLDSIEALLPRVFAPTDSSQPGSQPTATSAKGRSCSARRSHDPTTPSEHRAPIPSNPPNCDTPATVCRVRRS